jgi:hypothetical protein
MAPSCASRRDSASAVQLIGHTTEASAASMESGERGFSPSALPLTSAVAGECRGLRATFT